MFLLEGIDPLQLWLMIASIGLVLIATIAILSRTVPLNRYVNRQNAEPDEDRSHLIGASVVVYAHNDHEALLEMLPRVLSQDYPAGYEVIVVNDGESADVSDVVEHFRLSFPNLYFTVAPQGARNLSRKKLALTLGIKAAKYPVVVHTTSSARPMSDRWLYSIMRHFDPTGPIDVVLGYAAPLPSDDKAFGARVRSFDSSIENLGWVSPAAKHRPWRGIEHNLAYRRDVFFNNKGFSRHLNLHDGDDDIFVSEISRGYNTALELSDESVVEVPGAYSKRTFKDRFQRRRFTRRFIRRRPRVAGTVAMAAYFLAPLPLAGVLIVAPVNWITGGCAGAIFLWWFLTGRLWNRSVRILRGRSLRVFSPVLAWSRPIRLFIRAVGRISTRQKRYTWE